MKRLGETSERPGQGPKRNRNWEDWRTTERRLNEDAQLLRNVRTGWALRRLKLVPRKTVASDVTRSNIVIFYFIVNSVVEYPCQSIIRTVCLGLENSCLDHMHTVSNLRRMMGIARGFRKRENMHLTLHRGVILGYPQSTVPSLQIPWGEESEGPRRISDGMSTVA
jgi:hypothetical protein